ncbi:hypothetical protein M9458_051515 [Cirrhinus mrigala]|uniref:Integrase catalytic domain-containing protein n=1 Tax=Cirrhinus mrigala TaxID=683832 RepID=A0ABD0MT26_CIRMR
MDPGSSAMFCTETLIKQLNVRGKKAKILLRTMGQERPVDSYIVSDLEVCGLEEKEYVDLPKVYTQKRIPVRNENIPSQRHIEKWPYLSKVHLPTIDAEIGLLMGTNIPKALEPWQVINSEGNGPYALKTALGWVVNGLSQETGSCWIGKEVQPAIAVNRISVESIEHLLVQQYNTDFAERCSEDKPEMSQDDHQFMRFVEKSTQLVDGCYCIGLPMKTETAKMPNNHSVAEQHANSLKRRLSMNPDLHKDYKIFMKDVITKGYGVQVPKEQLNRDDGRVWYIPHHGIYHPKKHKIRIVFDCNATYQGTSLNKQLLQGPDLTNSLVGVLIRFRQEPVALMADIESVFYRVKVPDKDTDLLRFLWWPEGDLAQPLLEYRMVVHLFGATSSPSCASYALRRTAEDASHKVPQKLVDTVLQNFYVDDYLNSVSTETHAIVLAEQLRNLCPGGGFHLTKWISNSRAVLSSIPVEGRAKEVKDLDLSHSILPMERALGVQWSTETDMFTFKVQIQAKQSTRQGILSVVSSIYDRLGFLAPVILPAKQLLRNLCKDKKGWDEEIQEDQEQKWCDWLSDLQQLSRFTVPRCIKPANCGSTKLAQLHHFADASETGYGTVTYILMKNDKGDNHCSFLMAKSRVSPLKQITVPGLELTAAVVAVKIDKMMRQELRLNLEKSVFWTYSMTVLKYIENQNTRFKTFVANRLAVIQESTTANQWRYVNTTLNPADNASRGMRAEVFIRCESWIQGPSYLLKDENEWPKRPDDTGKVANDDVEVKKSASVNVAVVDKSVDTVNLLINYYSNWHQLKRAVAWFLRFKEVLLSKQKKRKELKDAVPQSESNAGKCNTLLNQKMQKHKEVWWSNALTLDELERAESELIRFTQREKYADEIATLQKNKGPVKKSSSIYKLDPVLQDGVLRVGGRLNKSAMPEETKRPVILSKDLRIATLVLQHIHEELGHSVRAIHIEVAHSLDTDSCINALRRFICRRGQVAIMRSDQGTNFISADKELREAIRSLNQNKIQDAMSQKGIQWIFNPPAASHHGGAWERQIRTIWKVLMSVLKQQNVDDEGLQTVLCEVEAIVNDRPITKTSDDPNDLDALTPNHLLLLKTHATLPPGTFKKEDFYARRRWKQAQYLADLFWTRWTAEYLPQVQERQKWSKTHRNLQIGDVVLIVDHCAPRNSWRMGRIIKTMPDSNGTVRRVVEQTKTNTLERPITKLCFLEEAV